VSWPAVSTAVSLLSRQQLCPEVSRDALLDGQPRDDVAMALEIIAAAVIGVLSPDDRGARALEALGQLAAEKSAEQ